MRYRRDKSAMRTIAAATLSMLALLGCKSTGMSMKPAELEAFGTYYTAAWCSQKPAAVASCYAEDGSLTINGGTPAVGRKAIAAVAQSFMTAYPDMVVTMTSISKEGHHVVYRWTLIGTNLGPGGTGNAVCVGGSEEWTFAENGLIAESIGHFDQADLQRQLDAQ